MENLREIFYCIRGNFEGATNSISIAPNSPMLIGGFLNTEANLKSLMFTCEFLLRGINSCRQLTVQAPSQHNPNIEIVDQTFVIIMKTLILLQTIFSISTINRSLPTVRSHLAQKKMVVLNKNILFFYYLNYHITEPS